MKIIIIFFVLFMTAFVFCFPQSNENNKTLNSNLLNQEIESTVYGLGLLKDFAPDPGWEMIVTGSSTGKIYLWDIKTGELLDTLGVGYWRYSLDWSSDSKNLLYSKYFEVTILNIEDGNVINFDIPRYYGSFELLEFSPDESAFVFVSKTSNTIGFFKIATKEIEKTYSLQTGNCYDIEYSPDGSKLAANEGSRLIIWDIETDVILFDFKEHSGHINSLSWHPDGTKITTASDDSTIKVWDLDVGKEENTFVLGDSVKAVAWSHDGSMLAAGGSDDLIKVINYDAGEVDFTFEGHTNTIFDLYWSPDDKQICSGSRDGTVRIWSLEKNLEILRIDRFSNPVVSFRWLNNEDIIAASSADGNSIEIWNTAAQKDKTLIEGHTEGITEVEFSYDGGKVATGGEDNNIKIWNTSDGTEEFTLEGHKGDITALAWKPVNNILASGADDLEIKLWNTESGELIRTMLGHIYGISVVEWKKSGDELISADKNRINIWNTEIGYNEKTLKITIENIYSLEFSPNGEKFANGGPVDSAYIWDYEAGKIIKKLKDFQYYLQTLSWSPGGMFLAGGTRNGIVVVGNIINDAQRYAFYDHNDEITKVAWSPDGRKLASSSLDGTLIVWNFDQILGIDDQLSENIKIIEIYPNPAGDYINISIEKFENPLKAVITDIFGNEIRGFSINSDHYRLDVQSFSGGMYFLRIYDSFEPGNAVIVRKFVVRR